MLWLRKHCPWIPTLKSLTSFTLTLKTPWPACPTPSGWSYSSVLNTDLILHLPAKQDFSDTNPNHNHCPIQLKSKLTLSISRKALDISSELAISTLKTHISIFVMYTWAFFSLMKWIEIFTYEGQTKLLRLFDRIKIWHFNLKLHVFSLKWKYKPLIWEYLKF